MLTIMGATISALNNRYDPIYFRVGEEAFTGTSKWSKVVQISFVDDTTLRVYFENGEVLLYCRMQVVLWGTET